jgi:hypothetical protein
MLNVAIREGTRFLRLFSSRKGSFIFVVEDEQRLVQFGTEIFSTVKSVQIGSRALQGAYNFAKVSSIQLYLKNNIVFL